MLFKESQVCSRLSVKCFSEASGAGFIGGPGGSSLAAECSQGWRQSFHVDSFHVFPGRAGHHYLIGDHSTQNPRQRQYAPSLRQPTRSGRQSSIEPKGRVASCALPSTFQIFNARSRSAWVSDCANAEAARLRITTSTLKLHVFIFVFSDSRISLQRVENQDLVADKTGSKSQMMLHD
jgi:hypothetical protein